MARLKKEDLDCTGCEARRPELLEGNVRVWNLLMLASNQWREGRRPISKEKHYIGPVSLDFGVVMEMAKAMRIRTNGLFLKKLKAFEDVVIASRLPSSKPKGDRPNV